jgi:catechol 2,3-dioxygenase-like lactoylglutathione lyase family enzyme
MFHHVAMRVSDLEASERFFATVLPVLGGRQDDFVLLAADADHPATRRLHIAFYAPTTELADAFWEAGTRAGYESDGEPGPRPVYGPDYYGAFLLDPDGNSVEAVSTENPRPSGAVDHLWIRVADVAAAKTFYESIAGRAGIHLGSEEPERAQFRGEGSTFSLVAGGAPTERVHLAFPAAEAATLTDPDGNTVELVAAEL